MASMLLLGRFDLLDEDSPVRLDPEFAAGVGPPTVSEIQSTVLDGAVVTGSGTGNRNPSIPIYIPSSACAPGFNSVALMNEVLLYVNQATWELVFIPEDSAAMVLDCFRATVAFPSTYAEKSRGLQRATITCEALPFGRSQQSQSISLVSTGLTLDTFDTKPTVTGAASSSVNTNFPTFDGSSKLDVVPVFNPSGPGVPALTSKFTIAKTGLSVAAPGGVSTASLEVTENFNGSPTPPESPWKLTITTTTGTYTATSVVVVIYQAYKPLTFMFDPPAPAGSVITGWSLAVPKFPSGTPASGPISFDSLQTAGGTSGQVSSTNGAQLVIPAVLGTARAPVGVTLTRSDASAFSGWCLHTPPAGATAQALVPVNARFRDGFSKTIPAAHRGTYSVWVAAMQAADQSETATFTITQSNGGSQTFTLNLAAVSGATVNTFTYAGEVTLPLGAGLPPESAATLTFSAAAQVNNTTVLDILLLDTRGRTNMVSASAPAQSMAWVDEPAPGQLFGGVYSGPSRAAASSVQPYMPAAAALMLSPGDARILLYGLAGPLLATLTYAPRWLQDADWPTP